MPAALIEFPIRLTCGSDIVHAAQEVEEAFDPPTYRTPCGIVRPAIDVDILQPPAALTCQRCESLVKL